jgi:DNA polymerase-3 subunit epsilon
MMAGLREIVLDTETTGLEPAEGHRIVEIGAVELLNHMPTGRTFHKYINPQRAMPEEAFRIHGLSDDFLRDKPVFAEVVAEFVAFIGDARLVIHNAAFDMKFINAELSWLDLVPIPVERAVDTVAIARRRFPGAQASLDALCRRFGIDNSGRALHGALLDSELLAEVYLELIGGRQPDFALAVSAEVTMVSGGSGALGGEWRPRPRPVPLPPRITAEEEAAHDAFVRTLGDGALWLRP